MAEKRLYKIIFLNQGKVYELFGRKVESSGLWGFIEVSDLIFETGESLGEKAPFVDAERLNPE